jgi:O-antigen/teichoic acid export membrane protein
MKAMLQVFSLNAAGKVLLGIMTVLVIRYMPAEQFAHYTLALALATFVSQTLSSSFNSIYIVGHRRLGLETSFAALANLQVIILTAVWLLLSPLQGRMSGTFWWAFGFAISSCAVEFAKTAYQQQHRFLLLSIMEVIRSAVILISTAGLIYALRDHLRAWQVLAIQATSMLAVSAPTIRARLSTEGLAHLGRAREIAVQVLRGEYRFLFSYFGLVALLSQTGIFALKFLSSDMELASFGAAFRYYGLISLALAAVNIVLLPILQDSHTVGAVNAVFAQQAKSVVLFATAIVGCVLVAPWALPWLDRGRYPASVPTFQILALSAIISFALSPHANLVLRHEQFRFLSRLVLAAFSLHLLLAYFLVGKWGAVGAAWSAAAAFAFLNGLSYIRATALRRQPVITGTPLARSGPLANS